VSNQVWEKISFQRAFLQNFIAGVGWSFGASLGVVIIVGILTWILSLLGGLPVVGEFFAKLITTTQKALELRELR